MHSILFWRCKEHSCPLSPYLGVMRMVEVPDWGLASLSWFRYGQMSLIHPWSDFLLSILILKVQRTSMSFKSSFGALEDAGGSWLGFGILILILIWWLVFCTHMLPILALYLDFEGAKTIHVLSVLIWGFGECWRFLTGVWHLLEWPLVFDTPKFWISALYLDFEGAKNINVL